MCDLCIYSLFAIGKDNVLRRKQRGTYPVAIRRLINNNLVEKKWQCNNIVVGSITLVYNHNKNEILNNLTTIQDEYFSEVLSTQHFHLDHSHCMDIVAVKGKAIVLTELADKLKAIKGIQHGKLTMSKAD